LSKTQSLFHLESALEAAEVTESGFEGQRRDGAVGEARVQQAKSAPLEPPTSM
jgi:hypothetical protein